MSTKTDLIDNLITELKGITPNVFDRLKFLDEINDYPSICVVATNEAREFQQTGESFGHITLLIRGYTQAEDAINSSEDLIEQILPIVDAFKSANVIDAQATNVTTDLGLFEPFGIFDIEAAITYC